LPQKHLAADAEQNLRLGGWHVDNRTMQLQLVPADFLTLFVAEAAEAATLAGARDSD
jgi:hypothetical protein